MNNLTLHSDPSGAVQPSFDSFWSEAAWSASRKPRGPFLWVSLLAGLLIFLFSAPAARADRVPANCSGSGLGITLFTSIPDVHIGDTLYYSVNVFNGTPAGSGLIACDATSITAFIVTPDGRTNNVTLLRTTMHQGDADFYPNVVSYVVRAQDIQPDGTLLATARDIGVIHQNDVDSIGGGFQGVNTQVNLPCVLITALCVGGVGENGLITFTGSVTNCGNNTLVGVTVTNFVNNGAFTVLFPTNLAFGQSATFSGSWLPVNPCGLNTAILTVRATDQFTSTPQTVTNITTIACQNTLTPGILVTKTCPAGPVSPGQLLTFSGSVSNTGNVILTNIVVLNNQPAANTTVFTLASLAPDAVANFTGSYLAPTNCSVSDTLTANAASICGVPVTSSASATCPIATAPQIVVNVLCPLAPVLPGAILTYSGTVSNAGNIMLTNIIVLSDRPASNTVVFTQISLAPGATANFTGSYQVPTNCCVVWNMVQASGQGCAGTTVTDSATRVCSVLTLPKIVVTKVCTPGVLRPGDLLTYSGSVSNAGNITLINVTVVDNQPAGSTPVLGPVDLAPGQSVTYNGSYIVPPDFCGTDTITASGQNVCTFLPVVNSVTTTCPVTTAPRLIVTKNCPLLPTPRGGLYTYTGSVSNAGNVTLINVFVVNDQPTNPTPVIGPITLPPGVTVNFTNSYTAPFCCCFILDTLTAVGQDRCSGSNVTATATTVCPLLMIPGLIVMPNCPVTPIPMGSVYNFSGYVTNTGNVVLTNVFVFGPQGTNSPVLGPIQLAPGESEVYSGSYTVPLNLCSVPVTASGQDICGGNLATNLASCPVATAPQIAVTADCPAAPVVPGGSVTYSGTVWNTGNITLLNVVVVSDRPAANTIVFTVASLDPGTIASFTSAYTVPANACALTTTFTGTGKDLCTPTTVTNTVSTTCVVTTTPSIAITETCPPGPVIAGSSVAFGGLVSNTGNITLTNVFVFSSNPSNNVPVVGPLTLAPGASAAYLSSYIATSGSNPATNSTIVTNGANTVTTNVASVITTNNTVTITTNAIPPAFVTIRPPLAPPTGEVVNRFLVGTNLNGLTYYGGDLNSYGPTMFYSIRHPDVGSSILTIIKTEVAPHTALPRTEPKDVVGIRNYDALAFAAPQITGASSLSLYYLRHDAVGASYFGYIIPGGVYTDMFIGGSIGTNFDALTFAAPNASGSGLNLFYYLRHDNTGSYFGTINPDAATAATAATDLFNFGKKIDYMTFSTVDAGYGPATQFYYLRYDTNGDTVFGTIDATPGFVGTPAQRAVDRFTITGHFQELEFTPTDVGYGTDLFYSILSGNTFTTNIVTTFTTNLVTTLTTNLVTTYTTNSVVSFTPNNSVIALGTDNCQARTVSALANCLGPIAQAKVTPMAIASIVASGSFQVTSPTVIGVTYTLQYKNTLSDPFWIDLETVAGTGGNLPFTDPTSGVQPMRFYRIISTP